MSVPAAWHTMSSKISSSALCRTRRQATLQILRDEAQGALGEIAEAIAELGIGALDDRFGAVAAVIAETDLGEQEIAQLVDAVALRPVERIDDVAERFRHLGAAIEQEAVAEHGPGQREARAHQEGGPIDGVEADDILADDVDDIAAIRPSIVPSARYRRDSRSR